MRVKSTFFHRALAFAVAAIGVCAIAAAATTVTGAGSTFVYPILAKWSAAYKAKTRLPCGAQYFPPFLR